MRMAPPTAKPPKIRAMINKVKFVVSAESRAEPVKNTAVVIKTFFRPKRSLKNPATAVPPRTPQPRETTPQQRRQKTQHPSRENSPPGRAENHPDHQPD